MLVEPACAAGLSVAYLPDLLENLDEHGTLLARAKSPECSGLVLIVCGGSSVTLDLLAQWKTRVGL